MPAGKRAHNSPDPFLANIDEVCFGQWLKVTVEKGDAFTIWNQRNKFERRKYGQGWGRAPVRLSVPPGAWLVRECSRVAAR